MDDLGLAWADITSASTARLNRAIVCASCAVVPGHIATVTFTLKKGVLKGTVEEAGSEIARTLAFEALDTSTELIGAYGAVDTGAMRASGYVEVVNSDGKGGPGAAGVVWTPGEAGEAKVAYGAEYTEYVHEGYGSSAPYGPRPFLTEAEKDIATRARGIAQDIVDRLFGG